MTHVRLLVTSHLAAYCGVAVFWLAAEYLYPGTRYASPWLPALYVSSVLGPFVAAARLIYRDWVRQRHRIKPGVD